jgi:ABC-2 type transport system permease protein
MKRFGLTRAIAAEHLRDPSYSIWLIAMPILGYAAAALFLGDGTPLKDGSILGAALLLSLCVQGSMNLPLGLRALADAGLERRMALWPIPRRALVVSAVASDASLALCACGIVLALGAIFGVPLRRNPLGWAVALSLSAVFALAFDGAVFASGAAFMAIKNYGNLLFMLLALASGIFFRLPGKFVLIQAVFPTYHLARLFMRAAGSDDPTSAWNLIVPVAWIAASLAFALLRGAKRRSLDA